MFGQPQVSDLVHQLIKRVTELEKRVDGIEVYLQDETEASDGVDKPVEVVSDAKLRKNCERILLGLEFTNLELKEVAASTIKLLNRYYIEKSENLELRKKAETL